MKPVDRLERMRQLTEQKYKQETGKDGTIAPAQKKPNAETQTEAPKKRGRKKKEA